MRVVLVSIILVFSSFSYAFDNFNGTGLIPSNSENFCLECQLKAAGFIPRNTSKPPFACGLPGQEICSKEQGSFGFSGVIGK